MNALETAGSQQIRDFIGYSNEEIDFEWPGGARLAVDIVVNYEEGAERNVLDGDSENEQYSELNVQIEPGGRDFVLESLYEYGSRVAIWRLFDMFDRYGITPSVFACALALKRNPVVTESFVSRRYDIVGHGYKWVSHFGASEDEERSVVRKSITTIQEVTGRRIEGWFTRPPQTNRTRQVLAEEGLLYDSSAFGDDLPYFDTIAGRPFLLVPYSQDLNDGRFWRGDLATGREFGQYCIDTFDVLWREAQGRQPRMMSIGLHPRIIGRPGRIVGLERFLEHAAGHGGTWFATRTEIAHAWANEFASADVWNWHGENQQS